VSLALLATFQSVAHLSCTQIFTSYLTVNTTLVCYKDKPVNMVGAYNQYLLWELHETCTYMVRVKCRDVHSYKYSFIIYYSTPPVHKTTHDMRLQRCSWNLPVEKERMQIQDDALRSSPHAPSLFVLWGYLTKLAHAHTVFMSSISLPSFSCLLPC
jgi:hypothetical protein